jgi:fructoselysine 3-epimerase
VYVNFSIDETIRQVAAAGYDGIDIWGGRPHVYRQDFSDLELGNLKKLISDNGLSVPSFMPAFFRYPHNLSSPNEIIRQDSLDYMRQCIDHAAILGAEIVLLVPGRTLHGQSNEDAWNRLLESVALVSEYASRYPLRLAIEPVNGYVSDLVNTASDGQRLVEQIGSEHLGIVLDTGHIHLSSETPQEAVSLTGGRLFQIHANDNNGKQQQNLILGRGTFDFQRFFHSLRKAGFGGFVSAELAWEYTLDPDPVVRQTASVLRQIMGEGHG